MTPEPPPPADGASLPPRHRPLLGNLAGDTTEADLWDFDDELETPEPPAPPEAARSAGKSIPAPREQLARPSREGSDKSLPKIPTVGGDQIRMNLNKAPRKDRSTVNPGGGVAKTESEFEDLDSWEDTPAPAEVEELPPIEVVESAASHPTEIKSDMPVAAPVPDDKPAPVIPAPPEPIDDQFEPVMKEGAQPLPLRPHLGLTKLERVGLIALIAMLMVAGILGLGYSIFRLPTKSERADANDFPIQGEKITVTSAVAYWRAPITEGDQIDICRRGTLLLPVVDLVVKGGPSIIRVFFKDDEGATVGDPIIRRIDAGGTVVIPATAGFDEPGMYAAYRTGGADPWSVHVFEIPSGDVAEGKAKLLFEMNLSDERR